VKLGEACAVTSANRHAARRHVQRRGEGDLKCFRANRRLVGRKNHDGSRSVRGTQVAAILHTLCETARLVGVDPQAYLLRAVYAAMTRSGMVTFPEDLRQ